MSSRQLTKLSAGLHRNMSPVIKQKMLTRIGEKKQRPLGRALRNNCLIYKRCAGRKGDNRHVAEACGSLVVGVVVVVSKSQRSTTVPDRCSKEAKDGERVVEVCVGRPVS